MAAGMLGFFGGCHDLTCAAARFQGTPAQQQEALTTFNTIVIQLQSAASARSPLQFLQQQKDVLSFVTVGGNGALDYAPVSSDSYASGEVFTFDGKGLKSTTEKLLDPHSGALSVRSGPFRIFADGAFQYISGGGNIISNDGASIISNDGASFKAVTIDAANTKNFAISHIISDNGGGLVGNSGGTLLGDAGAAIISDNGGGIISTNGAGIISTNGAGIISDHGVGIVSTSGSGIAAAGGSGLVAVGGGPNFSR
jgi:hypothetical protein